MTHEFSNQAADGLLAGDVGFWNRRELTSDPIESFASVNPLASDPIEQFSDSREGGALHSAPVEAPAHLDSNFDSLLFDSASACSNAGIADDGFITPSLARSAAGDTVMDTMSDDGCRDHSATQRGFAQILDLQKPQFIWEQDSFLSAVFGKGNVVDDLFPHVSLKRPASLPVDLTGDEAEEAPIHKALRRGQFRALYSRAIKHSAVVHEETQRANFMAGWTSIVLLNLFAFAAFDKARCENLETELRAVVYTTVVECLSRKATSTVGKRLGAIRRFAEFCTARALPPFPLDDSCMHAYLLCLSTDARARGSSGKSFLEAVRFTSSMLGLRSKELQLISQRVTGLADSLVKQAPVIEQAIALTVEQIKKIEMICCNSESLQDRALVGGILLMIYGSARASDMARAIKLLVDRDVRLLEERDANEPEGFIELAVLGNKGARSDVHRQMLLPVVAPMMSLSGAKWWDAFLEARMALGLETEGRLKWPLLCRFDSDGKPLEQNLTASEIGELLRQCLNIRTERRNVVRSHSCKVTILSWLAKYGTELHVRRLVGHHLDVGAKSAETYARDSMAPAMRAVAQVVNAVIQGVFAPDVTRSGRFLKPPPKDNSTTNDGENSDGSYEFPFSDDDHVGGDTDATATDSSSDAGSTSSETVNDATTLWELLRPELRPALVDVGTNLEKYTHTISFVVHLKQPTEKKFLCGRVCNNRYESRSLDASEECPKCTTCFGSKEALAASDSNADKAR